MTELRPNAAAHPLAPVLKSVSRLDVGQTYKLRWRMLYLIGAMFLLTLLFSAASVIGFVYRAETEAWRGRQGEAARSAARAVANFIQRAEDILVLVGVTDLEDREHEKTELANVLGNNPAFLEIIHLDAQGNVVVGVYQDQPVLANLFTIPQSKWFVTARSGQPYLGDVQLSASNEPYLIIALPGRDEEVVAGRLRMNLLWEVVADIRFGQQGRAYVVSRAGQVIAHTNPEIVLAHTSIEGKPELLAWLTSSNQEWYGEYVNFDAIPVVAATAPVPGVDWVVVTELPQSEAFGASRTALPLLGGGMLLLGLVAMWITSRLLAYQVFEPMEKLRIGTERIGQGDLQHRIGLNRPDEIGQVAAAFDEMTERLHQREQQLAAGIEALQQSEARYRGIVEDQTELICRFLPDGTLTFVNQAYCRYFGRPREALVGQTFMPFIPAEDQELVAKMSATLSQEKPVINYEHRVILPDGTIRWQHWTDRILFDEQNQFIEFQAVGRDVTERKEAQEALEKAKDELEIRVAQRTAELREANGRLRVELTERQRAEEALAMAKARLQHLLTASATVIYTLEPGGNYPVTFMSENSKSQWGYEPRQFTDDPQFWPSQIHPEDKDVIWNNFNGVFAKGHDTYEYRFLYANGQYRWIRDDVRLVTNTEGQPIELIGSCVDITGRKQAEEQLKTSLEEKILLLKEIHHRVKNNLQVISSLLFLQSDRVKDQQTHDILRDSQNRVKSMALIHEKLYRAKDLANVELGDYVKNLASQLFRSYQRQSTAIRLHVNAAGVFLGIDAAVPCGLILNELISNALKHAFPNDRSGNIYVELQQDQAGWVRLQVRDDGLGFPDDVDFQNTNSLGLQLVNTLAQQLDGTVELHRNGGTKFIITFSEITHKP
jgi:PAS domain S-box-containing protein